MSFPEVTSKDMFLANMSHEIRTPLNGILGYSQLLSQTFLTDTQKKYVCSINSCSLQLMQLVNDVIDFSKLSTGKMIVKENCFSITEVITELQQTFSSRLEEKKEKLFIEIDENVPAYIIGDKQKILQILINLVSNSIKFSNIESDIRVKIYRIEDKKIKIEVIDHGIGISEYDIPKLFNAFVQLNSMSTQGSGLGLVIVKKLTTLLSGDVSVESVEGEGSVFSFTFQFEEYQDILTETNKNTKLLNKRKILLVDDQEDNRIIISGYLYEWGMNPVVCATPLEALRLVLSGRHEFDIALLDICMPNTSGVELAEQIKEERPFLPLIALSSMENFVNDGNFVDKLDKPVNKRQLFESIHDALEKKHNSDMYLQEESTSSDSDSIVDLDKDVSILIVEDVSFNSDMLGNMLSNLGYTNQSFAENGKIALRKIKRRRPGLILLDLRMPVLDGYGVLEYMKKKNIEIPIIILTASTLDEDKELCRKYGIKYFLTKPIDFANLKELVYKITNIK